MTGRTWISARLLGLAIAAGAGAGCDEPVPVPPGVNEPVGAVSLTLQVGARIHIAAVDYALDRGDYHRTGSLSLASSTVLSGTISPIPPGPGYTLRLDASNVGGESPRVHCAASTTLDVAAGATTSAMVSMRCMEEEVAQAPAAVPLSSSTTRGALALALLAIGAALTRRRARSRQV